MIAREIPFAGLNGVQVSVQVTTKNLRPIIPDDLDPDVARLIESCWNTNPEYRPSFGEIVKELKRIRNNLVVLE
jgi:sterile alpha motif and leucine zipper containing kinase AZK